MVGNQDNQEQQGQPNSSVDRVNQVYDNALRLRRAYKKVKGLRTAVNAFRAARAGATALQGAAATSPAWGTAAIIGLIILIIVVTLIIIFGSEGSATNPEGCYTIAAPDTNPAPVSATVDDYFTISGGTSGQKDAIRTITMYSLKYPKLPPLLRVGTKGKIRIKISSAQDNGGGGWLTTDRTTGIITVYQKYFSGSKYTQNFYINHEIGHIVYNRNAGLTDGFYGASHPYDTKCYDSEGYIKTFPTSLHRNEVSAPEHESFAEAYADTIFCKTNQTCRYTGSNPGSGDGSIDNFPGTCSHAYSWMTNNVLGTTTPVPVITVCPPPPTAETCEDTGGVCATSCPPSSNPTYVADTTGAICSDTAVPTCCVPPPVVNTNLPGYFKPPFACGLKYWGWTYKGHSAYSVDFNRNPKDLGDPVRAEADGTVTSVILYNGQITIHSSGNYDVLFAHMKNISVRQGDKVKVGQQVGRIGNVGISLGSHLHVTHRRNGINIRVAYNDKPYLYSVLRWSSGTSPRGPLITGECP